MLERISRRERSDLLIAWLAISISFAIIFIKDAARVNPLIAFLFLGISLITVGIGFVLHEMAHKFTAIRFGYWAEFRKDNLMLVVAVALAALVGALKDLRIHWLKPQTKDTALSEIERRQAETTAKMLKLLTVSSYGVSVRIHGLACPPLAESITGYGRWALQTAWNTAEQQGLHPVYGDTDSLFLENAAKDKVTALIKTIKENLRLDLAVERNYPICVLSKAKKAYFGILPDGTPDLKGLTAIKSNAPNFIQQVFKTSVKQLAKVRNITEYEHAKTKIAAIVENSIREQQRILTGYHDNPKTNQRIRPINFSLRSWIHTLSSNLRNHVPILLNSTDPEKIIETFIYY
jgi:hypothetical protein